VVRGNFHPELLAVNAAQTPPSAVTSRPLWFPSLQLRSRAPGSSIPAGPDPTRPDPACVLGVLESSRFVLLVLFVYWPQYLVLCAVSSSLAPPTRGCCCCCCIGVACRRRLLVQMCQSTQPRLNPQWGEKRFTVHLTTHATPHLQCHHAGKSHAHSHTVTPQGGSELGRGEFASPDV
jgi:hypothetical protein